MAIDFTKPIQTRGGIKARVICTNLKNDDYPVLVVFVDEFGQEIPESYTRDGKLYKSDAFQEPEMDLINIEENQNAN